MNSSLGGVQVNSRKVHAYVSCHCWHAPTQYLFARRQNTLTACTKHRASTPPWPHTLVGLARHHKELVAIKRVVVVLLSCFIKVRAKMISAVRWNVACLQDFKFDHLVLRSACELCLTADWVQLTLIRWENLMSNCTILSDTVRYFMRAILKIWHWGLLHPFRISENCLKTCQLGTFCELSRPFNVWPWLPGRSSP